eukprot:3206706-Pleurochrysis_carterae.AAC.1
MGAETSRTVSKAAGDRLRRGSGASGTSLSVRRAASASSGCVEGCAPSVRTAVVVLRSAAPQGGRLGGSSALRSATVEVAASEMRLAMACAMVRLRSGG